MKDTISRKIFNIFNIVIITLLCVIMVYPYLNQLAMAFNDSLDTSLGGLTVYPRVPTLTNFKTVLANSQVKSGLIISTTRTVFATLLALLVTYMAAYALASRDFKGRKAINLYLSIPMYLSAGTIPMFILYRYLGLINSYWVYILPGMFSFYNMLIIRSYLEGIPKEIEESSKIDGANEFLIMIKIMLPMSMPVVATIILWLAVGYWNDWMTTMYYITKPNLYTLQYVMMQIIKQAEVTAKMAAEQMQGAVKTENQTVVTSESVQAAVLIIATVPILVVYPFLQKYFVKGIMLGSVKG